MPITRTAESTARMHKKLLKLADAAHGSESKHRLTHYAEALEWQLCKRQRLE